MFTSRKFLPFVLTLMVGSFAAGCASETEDEASEATEAELAAAAVHEPKGEERKAIYAAFRAQLDKDLHDQDYLFNSTDPRGRFQRHGDWAYFEGILEGPDGNKHPVNYQNSVYKEDAEWLDGVQRNGHFAARFAGFAHLEANGKWKLVKTKLGDLAYNVGYIYWQGWAGLPKIGFRDVFVRFPADDLHEPKGEERAGILAAIDTQVTRDVHGQAVAFNSTEPKGSFLVHDGWAYFSGIVEGPNGNLTPVNYQNSVYKDRIDNGFEGLLRNGNFAATCSAILKKQANGTWKLAPTTEEGFSSPGYAVGSSAWIGSPKSEFAYDILPLGEGEGEGEGDGD